MQPIKTHSVATQLMRIVFALYCVVAVIVTSIHIVKEYNYTQASIERELTSSERIFGDVLGKALWSLDRDQLTDILNSIMELPVVVGVEIVDLEDNPFDTKGIIATGENQRIRSDLLVYRFPIHYQYQDQDIDMGFALVYSSSDVVLDRIGIGFFFLAVNAIFKGIALWAIFLWISRRLLATPLATLTQKVQQVRFDTLTPLDISPDKHKPNEIDALALAFSNMVDQLIESKEELLRFNQSLEGTVQERTQDLMAQKKIAEHALKVKSEFLATMSHEIRTPMNGVLGMLNLMAKTQLSSKQYDYLEMARSSAQSLLVIINDILDFSKIEAGKVEIEKVEFELLPLIHSLMHVLINKSDKKNIELMVDTTELKHPHLIGDPHRLRQIITNLTDNAIKFTEVGWVTVTFKSSVKPDEPERVQLICDVQDTGIGIPVNKLDRLFENFNQVDSSTTRRYGGTGLGLAISKRLAQLMGGDIKVSSQEGQGSSFKLSLTLSQLPWREVRVPDLNEKCIALVFSTEEQGKILEKPLLAKGATTIKGTDANHLLQKLQNNPRLTPPTYIVIEVKNEKDAQVQIITLRTQTILSTSQIIPVTTAQHELHDDALQTLALPLCLLKPITHYDLMAALWRIQNPDVVADDTPESESVEPLSKHKRQRILLVEDNFINQQVAIELLEEQGHTVVTADNGERAVALLQQTPSDEAFDLIFMDCQMPVMDGYTASEIIRRGEGNLSAYRDTPIIAMTANTLEGDKERCLEAGMTNYLPKPIVAEDLYQLIEQLTA